MLLQTTLIRQGGSTHELDGIRYCFAPRVTDGPHVCEVATSAHVKRFLGIDGFEIADEPAAPVTHAPLVLDEAGFLGTKAVTAPVFTAAPPPIQMDSDNRAAAAAAVLAALPVTVSSPIVPPAASILDGTDAVAEPLPAPDYEAMDDDTLKAAFIARFDQKPHPKAKRPSIINTLRKADEPETAKH